MRSALEILATTVTRIQSTYYRMICSIKLNRCGQVKRESKTIETWFHTNPFISLNGHGESSFGATTAYKHKTN